MGAEVDELSEQYKLLRQKEGVTQLELARAETGIWNQLTVDHGKGRVRAITGERREWFCKQFGGTVSEYEVRASIFNAGAWAHQLLDLIDQGVLKITTGAHILRDARISIKQRLVTPENAVDHAMAVYAGQAPKPEVVITENSAPATDTRVFKRQITLLADAFVKDAFEGWHIDEHHLSKLVADFHDSIEMTVQELRHRIQLVKRDVRDEGIQTIGKVKFDWACQVLGLSQYKYKAAIDMRLVKRRKNQRALDLHPDRNSDKEKAAKELGNVLEAYSILWQYNEKNNRRAHDGNEA